MSDIGEVYIPTDQERQLAEDAYLEYATGVALLRDPDNEVSMAFNANSALRNDMEAVVFRAEVLMFQGLRKVIRLAHPARVRSRLSKMEHNYDAGLPYMIDTVNRVREQRSEELIRLDPAFDFVVPKPMANRTLYKYMCHPHMEKLFTISLLDSLVPAPAFESILESRNLSHLSSSPFVAA